MKAVLLSVRPEWCEKILNGEKTVEIRKSCPAHGTPFKVYIYCTKAQSKIGWLRIVPGKDGCGLIVRLLASLYAPESTLFKGWESTTTSIIVICPSMSLETTILPLR